MEDYEEIAYVQFIEGNNTQKVYRFALYDQAVSAGDSALVKSGEPHDFGLVRVVKVVPVSEYEGASPTAEVVCKVDISAYEARQKQRRRDILTARLNKLVEKAVKTLNEYNSLMER